MKHATFTVVIMPSVARDIRRFPKAILDHLDHAIHALKIDPFPPQASALHGEAGWYRVRVGHYRIIYSVAHVVRIVTIIKIGHRKDVYRRMEL